MPTDTNPNFKISGHVMDAEGKPRQGMIVRAYVQDAQSAGSPLGEAAVGNEKRWSTIYIVPHL